MIDLEDTLARIVELAPEPPDVAGVCRRARQRRSRRRGAAIAAGFIVVRSNRHRSAVIENPTDSVRVTMLDGSQLEISGPESLGLTKLQPAFNGELMVAAGELPAPAVVHSFTVERNAPDEPGAVVGRYPTHDGHELVVYATDEGVDAVVDYSNWALVVSWNHEPTYWRAWAARLSARETADGFIVIEPVGAGWHLGPTDAPDVQLGGETYGSGAVFSFFAPWTYPTGCPTAAETTARTSQGWPVSEVNGTWWCDPIARVRVRVGNPALADDAIRGLHIQDLAEPR